MLAVLALLLSAGLGHAAFQVPPLSGPVVDAAGMLSPQTIDKLSRLQRDLLAAGGAQIQVATVPDLGGVSIEEASIKMVERWQLGQKKTDRGVLLLIAKAERQARIEVGKGLEGDLPDVIANRIIQEVMVPSLKSGAVDEAVVDGVLSIAHYTDPQLLEQLTGQPHIHRRHQRPLGTWITFAFWIVIFLVFIVAGRSRNQGLASTLLWILFSGGRGGGGFGGGDSGGGGGGWGGGGGGFSGGGASGGW